MARYLFYNAGLVDLDKFTAEDVDTVQIARALSRINRFCGNFNSISVAQHAVLVAMAVKEMGGTEEQILAGLHHDDSEAFVGDIPSPGKEACERYQER